MLHPVLAIYFSLSVELSSLWYFSDGTQFIRNITFEKFMPIFGNKCQKVKITWISIYASKY